MRRLALPALLLLLLSLFACPWRSPGELVEDADVEVIVTGLIAGDRVVLELDDEETELVIDEQTGDQVRFYDTLGPGEHEAELELERGDERRCESVTFSTAAGELRTLALDAAQLEPCDEEGEDPEEDDPPEEPPPADAGPDAVRTLERLREVERDDTCSPEPCELETRVESDGSVEVRDEDDELEGQLEDDAWQALAALALSPAADALFAGDDAACPLASPPAGVTVELERRVQEGDDEDTRVTERLDITGCEGIAAELRTALAMARELAEPGVDEEMEDAGP